LLENVEESKGKFSQYGRRDPNLRSPDAKQQCDFQMRHSRYVEYKLKYNVKYIQGPAENPDDF